jgi:hypothetical protein
MLFRSSVKAALIGILCLLGMVMSGEATTLDAAGLAELVRQIETKLSSVQRQTVPSPAQAEKDLLQARDLISRLKEASPGHDKLASLQKRFDDLKEKLEKRLGRPLGGSAEPTISQPTPAQPPTSTVELPSAVVSQLNLLDTALTAATASLDKNQLQTANRRLDEARKLMSEIQTRYGAKIPAGNAQMNAAVERLEAVGSKVSQANAASAAAETAQAAIEQQKQAQSKEWMAKLSPFFDYKNELFLRTGSEFNNATPEEQLKARQAYSRANEILPVYTQTSFPYGKTQDLLFLEQKLTEYLALYNEKEIRNRQDQSCRTWVEAFRAYVDVSAGSSKNLVVGTSVSEDELGELSALLDEATTFWQTYQKAEFPYGKSLELLALEERMQQQLTELPESMRRRRVLVSADIDKEFMRVLNYLRADTGWRSDPGASPNIVMEQEIESLREAVRRYAGMVGADAKKLASLRELLGEVELQDQANRVVRAERTFMKSDQYLGDDSAALRRDVEKIVKVKSAQARVLRTTLLARDWKEESVTEWTDTTRTALRYRRTRFMAAQAAAMDADGKVYLHAVHVASDRKSDGSWGPLYGHVMASDWMAEKNVGKEPPAP